METSIKQFIRLNGLKQRDLAQYLGISEPAVSNLVSGKNNPSEENLTKLIENEMGWDISPFITDSQNSNSGTIVNNAGHDNFFTPSTEKEDDSELVRHLREEVEYLRNLVNNLTSK